MSDIKPISPMLDNFCIGDPISDKNGVRSCPAMKENEDDRYIVKVVSIPASQAKLEALLLAGAYSSAEDADKYFLEQAQEIIAELEILNSFAEQDGFLPVSQWQLQPKEDNHTGYDVYILTDYRRTLKRQFYMEPLTHLNAVNLGIDICAALTVCRNAGYIYANLKPTNILVTPDKSFKISDLGFIKLDNLAYASLPERYRSAYTAPEVADAFSTLSSNMDVYALGLVLYQAYNNGALPFSEDAAPAQVFDAPANADSEIAEIILKACDPDPANRWRSPAEMGQALINYMQRNGANDTPIEPLSPADSQQPETEDATEFVETDTFCDTQTESSTTTEQCEPDKQTVSAETLESNLEAVIINNSPEQVYEDKDIDLSFMSENTASESLLDNDETIQPNYAAKSQTQKIEGTDTTSNTDKFNQNQSTLVFDASNNTAPVPSEKQTEVSKKAVEDPPVVQPRRKHKWIGLLIVIAVLIGLAAGAYCGYKFYYIKNIQSITLEGKLDTLSVEIKTDADDSLLTVYCVGNGTRVPADLVDGKATFTNLNPDQRYLVEVEISGLHALKGKTSATYYTPSQVSLEGLLIQVGDTDGSAKISFTTKKPYNGQWVVEYATEGEDKKSVESNSTNITVSDLTIGKIYDVSIFPVTGNNWVTNNTGTFTAQPVIRAQDVTIAEYKNGTLGLVWNTPSTVSSWTVHCYNNTDYNKTVTVSDCAATFDGLDPAQNYTVEIYADNQTQFQLLHIDDTTLPIDSFEAKIIENNFIELSWRCAKELPEGGWNLEYTMNESENIYKIEGLTEASYILKDAIPGAAYVFKLKAVNGAIVIVNDVEIAVPEAMDYSNDYGGTPFSKDSIELNMCIRPENDDWTGQLIKHTTAFKPGELAGFTTIANAYYNETVDAEIYILYVIRDENGALVMFNSQEMMWKELFKKYHGTLSIPELPGAVGKYTLEIYYNGGYVATQAFEITE